MFGFKKKSPGIDVEFYEQGKVEPFARSTLPIEQLPDTFQIETTLNIRGEEWTVSGARPTTKEEFRKTGRVQVFLFKPVIEYESPDDVLFSLPTISDEIGALEESASLENVFVVHEDDWRQQELVSRDFVERISNELRSIRQIYETQRVDVGFKSLHVRTSIPSPLLGVCLNLKVLMGRLGAAHVYRGVAFNSVAAVVRNGFAFRTANGSTLWGQRRDDDEVAILCIRPDESIPVAEALAPFGSFLTEFDLLFVDWIKLHVTPPIDL